MILFHAMEEKTLQKFLESKQELLALASTMTAAERQAGRNEIMEAATIYDVPEDMTDPRELYKVNGSTANIPVSGKLTSQVDVCDGFFSDVTTYGFISAAAQAADSDPSVQKIAFHFATGGGSIVGLDTCSQVLARLNKPTIGKVYGMCASAGYWLASQLDEIQATSPTDFIGSVGVAMEIIDRRQAEESRGYKRYVLTSTDAPDKRPDIGTEEGREKYIEELDAIHSVFVQRIAEGRGISREQVNSDFGKGGVLIASKAAAAGMIDGIENQPPAQAAGQTKREVQQMGLQKLLSENPAAKAEFNEAVTAARAEGAADVQARIDKVAPFLASKDYPAIIGQTALKVIKGEEASATLTAAVAAVDAMREDAKQKAAEEETGKQKETPGQQQKINEPGSAISSQEDIDAEVARMREGK